MSSLGVSQRKFQRCAGTVSRVCYSVPFKVTFYLSFQEGRSSANAINHRAG